MKVRAKLTHHTEVEIDEGELRRIIGDAIRKKFGLPSYAVIKDGKLIEEWEEDYGRHSSWESKVVRDATAEDEAALLVLHALNS